MKVSVIVPCLNAESYLPAALNSLLNQTHPPDEIIVADKGWGDSSRAIAAAYGPAVRLVDVPLRGASAARKAAADIATEDALMFLDADDLLAPDTLGPLANALNGGRGDIACCPWYRYEFANEAWRWSPPTCAARRPGQDDLAAWLTGWYHPPCAVLWSRAAYQRSGGWDPAIGVNDDGDVMKRGLAEGNSLAHIDKGAAFYRRHPNGASLSSTKATKKGIVSRLAVLGRLSLLLDKKGTRRRYDTAFSTAYAAISSDIGDEHPFLAERCRGARMKHEVGRTRGSAFPTRWMPRLAGIFDRARVWQAAERRGPLPEPVQLYGSPQRAPTPNVTPKQPLVSVIIPTYNRSATIGRGIASVLSQDYPEIELIVGDDGSTDATIAVLAVIGDPRLRVVRQSNMGMSAARNHGLRVARGAVMAFLDSDDEWLPGKLAAQMELFSTGPRNLGLVYGGFEAVQGEGKTTQVCASNRGWIYPALLVRNVVTGPGSSAVFRREALAAVGGFDIGLPAIEDYDLVLRVARFYQADCVSLPVIRNYDGDDAASPSTAAATRLSRNFAANQKARAILFARFGAEMKQARHDHQFFLTNAERELHHPQGTIRAACLDDKIATCLSLGTLFLSLDRDRIPAAPRPSPLNTLVIDVKLYILMANEPCLHSRLANVMPQLYFCSNLYYKTV